MNAITLRARLDGYLALRRALGFAMHAEERLLVDFVRFIESRNVGEAIPAKAALEWACSTALKCGPGAQRRRLSIARGFLIHLRAHLPDTQVPDGGLLPSPARTQPHLYSESEIAMLLRGAAELRPATSLRPHTIRTFIGLLLCCGVRAGEAMRLRDTDVHLEVEPPRLEVRQTKFRKSRWVPLHPTGAAALLTYRQQRRQLGYDELCENFFVSEKGTALCYQSVARTFVALARRLGIRGPAGERGASLHALRHTFAVNRLLLWHHEGVDVHARLPELSVYLGHVGPAQTYWYLSATPELLGVAAMRFEAHAGQGDDA